MVEARISRNDFISEFTQSSNVYFQLPLWVMPGTRDDQDKVPLLRGVNVVC